MLNCIGTPVNAGKDVDIFSPDIGDTTTPDSSFISFEDRYTDVVLLKLYPNTSWFDVESLTCVIYGAAVNGGPIDSTSDDSVRLS